MREEKHDEGTHGGALVTVRCSGGLGPDRVAGMNLLVVFGFLAVTHKYKPSALADVFILFGVGTIAAILMYVDYLDSAPMADMTAFAMIGCSRG